jgi:hypothetical protein
VRELAVPLVSVVAPSHLTGAPPPQPVGSLAVSLRAVEALRAVAARVALESIRVDARALALSKEGVNALGADGARLRLELRLPPPARPLRTAAVALKAGGADFKFSARADLRGGAGAALGALLRERGAPAELAVRLARPGEAGARSERARRDTLVGEGALDLRALLRPPAVPPSARAAGDAAPAAGDAATATSVALTAIDERTGARGGLLGTVALRVDAAAALRALLEAQTSPPSSSAAAALAAERPDAICVRADTLNAGRALLTGERSGGGKSVHVRVHALELTAKALAQCMLPAIATAPLSFSVEIDLPGGAPSGLVRSAAVPATPRAADASSAGGGGARASLDFLHRVPMPSAASTEIVAALASPAAGDSDVVLVVRAHYHTTPPAQAIVATLPLAAAAGAATSPQRGEADAKGAMTVVEIGEVRPPAATRNGACSSISSASLCGARTLKTASPSSSSCALPVLLSILPSYVHHDPRLVPCARALVRACAF